MKLSVLALTALFGFALANETVKLTQEEEDQCRKQNYVTGTGCDYTDCQRCLFTERCLYKPGGDRTSVGVCYCGVDSFPQGTCF